MFQKICSPFWYLTFFLPRPVSELHLSLPSFHSLLNCLRVQVLNLLLLLSIIHIGIIGSKSRLVYNPATPVWSLYIYLFSGRRPSKFWVQRRNSAILSRAATLLITQFVGVQVCRSANRRRTGLDDASGVSFPDARRQIAHSDRLGWPIASHLAREQVKRQRRKTNPRKRHADSFPTGLTGRRPRSLRKTPSATPWRHAAARKLH